MHYFGNLRTITWEGIKETRQTTPFFSSTFWVLTVCDIHFCIEKCQNSFSWSPPFGPFWSAKYLNFGGEICEIRILSHSIQEVYTLRKVKNQVLLFQSSWIPNLSDLMVYWLRLNSIVFTIFCEIFAEFPSRVRSFSGRRMKKSTPRWA